MLAPQRRALFWHLNFQNLSDVGVFVRFDFEMCFAPQRHSKVVRTWGFLYILTSKYVLRHNGVQLSISHLARWLRTRRFSEPTFRPPGATSHWKNAVFSRTCMFFLLTLSLLWFSLLLFSSLTLPTSAFHPSILSEVWLLNFLRQLISYEIFRWPGDGSLKIKNAA